MFGLIDCNNFYASCERAFNPSLNGKPIVVLSNNDGCVIARSAEAKKLGIPMGEPAYKLKELIETNQVYVFSSNYVLYGDMSHRVMNTIASFAPEMEVYSIDEAFVLLDGFENIDLKEYGENVVRTVTRNTGIPVSMGIAPTKTLAKVANKFAKKYKNYKGACVIDTDEKREKALKLT
jgi:DNA polymerase V